MSSFQWMWWHAANGARENFTTEAVALAINTQWRPISRVHGFSDLFAPDEEVSAVRAYTQRNIGGSGAEGILDLVIDVDLMSGRRSSWVEVKVDAPVSGDQMNTYKLARKLLPSPTKPTLLQLGGWERIDADVEWISWRDLVRGIGHDDGPLWNDLAAYLGDIGVISDAPDPITIEEVNAVPLAGALLRKTTHAIEGVVDATTGANLKGWVVNPKVHTQLTNSLRSWGAPHVLLYSPHWRVRLGIGFYGKDGRTHPAVRVGSDPKQRPVRDSLLNTAASSGNSADFELSAEGDWAVTAWAPKGVIESGALQGWFLSTVEDLAAAGLLSDLDESGKPIIDNGVSTDIESPPG